MSKVHPTYNMIQLLGEDVLNIDATNVSDLLKKMNEIYGKEISRRLSSVTILVNGININYLKGKKTPLQTNDNVHLVNHAGGG